ncbi:MAG: hypothetical protein OXB84_03795, partial [Halobacteriovoraceae bacterium]|nr:hypothetical protein [Halobacteriovoraceae bacterium]
MSYQNYNGRGGSEFDQIFQDIVSLFNKGLNHLGGNQKKKLSAIVILIIALLGFISSYYTVEPDEEAVIIRLGKYLGTYPPGLHFKIPFGIDRLEKLKTKLVHQAEFGFRTQKATKFNYFQR